MSVGDIRGYLRRWRADEKAGFHPKRSHLTVQQSIEKERRLAQVQAKSKKGKK